MEIQEAMIKLCGISDMHGKIDFDINPCDILCICGDIVPLKAQQYHQATTKWLIKEFLPWCDKQPCDKIFLIAGNHDLVFQSHEDEIKDIFKDTKVVYLRDEGTKYTKDGQTITIYGTPWCHQFYNWAFMTSDTALDVIFEKIPNKVDVLLTHDSPFGTSDILLQDVPWNNHNHLGCIPLGDAVDRQCPKLLLHGHLHSTNHELEKRNDTDVYNVSVVDEQYERVYEPLYLEI